MGQPDVEIVRSVIDAYRSFVPKLEDMRTKTTATAELFAIAAVRDEIDEKIVRHERMLRRLLRKPA